MSKRKLRSGLLKCQCEDCLHKFEYFSRDVDSMSSNYCPECSSLDIECYDWILDDVWTQDELESAKQRAIKLKKKLFGDENV